MVNYNSEQRQVANLERKVGEQIQSDDKSNCRNDEEDHGCLVEPQADQLRRNARVVSEETLDGARSDEVKIGTVHRRLSPRQSRQAAHA